MKQSIFALVSTLFLLTSCHYHDISGPPCEEFQLGEVCFYNDTNKCFDVKIDGTKTEILPSSSICIELESGYYNYKANRQGLGGKWTEEIYIATCETLHITL